ncbi:hypothetical protein EYF80_058153 [Liparis tanakae]|uniref:Uncharacterized protein n=1 Tax=Liparis tanakae TaxID=230148 RepID=A0A4Z2ESA5_9TELE|nr:hypothetical protein EYF80_058153 [Liparis tanakae]
MLSWRDEHVVPIRRASPHNVTKSRASGPHKMVEKCSRFNFNIILVNLDRRASDPETALAARRSPLASRGVTGDRRSF